jgi:queuine tRNA-ribosyltransferase
VQSQPLRFEAIARHGSARVGRLHTSRGIVDTPVFMPVGTRGAIKGLVPGQVEATGARIVLANTYHLIIHPGPDVVADLGGLHEFTGWKAGPILTDSGGYQVFSLSDQRNIDDAGVTFVSPRTGERIRFDPRRTVEWQAQMGSDFIMQLDECAPWPCTKDEAATAMRRSVNWAREGCSVNVAPHQTIVPIVQGSVFADLRRESAQRLVELNARAYAVGGLSVGEGQSVMLDVLDATLPELPDDRPRYLMGVGKPRDIARAVARGIDMFDCVIPTRNARHATAFTDGGVVRLRNAAHTRDRGPLDPACPCYTCTGGPGFSRGYLRHLFMVDDPTGHALVTIHNLTYYQRLMDKLRAAIRAGEDLDALAESLP